MIDITVKDYQQLTKNELYDLLQLRSEVFVVEQQCAYLDVDEKDQKALHVLAYQANKLMAYTRLFKPGDYFEEASIGRVVVRSKARKSKLGYTIMEASINAVEDYYKTSKIRISAQAYLKGFYNNLEFKEVGKGYLEDGIPHINMIKS